MSPVPVGLHDGGRRSCTTGGTAPAAAQLLREQGAAVLMALFAVDLPDLGGKALLEDDGVATQALIAFDGD